MATSRFDEHAGQQDDRALPKRQRAIRLRSFGQIQLVRVGELARRAFGQVDAALLVLVRAGAKDIMLVFFLRTRQTAPVFQHVKHVARLLDGDSHLFGQVVGIHGAMLVGESERAFDMRIFGARLHAAHFGITAQRHRRHAEARTAPSEPDAGAGKADHELGHAHAERTRRQVMAALVHEHEHRKHDGQVQNHHHDIHGRNPSRNISCSAAATQTAAARVSFACVYTGSPDARPCATAPWARNAQTKRNETPRCVARRRNRAARQGHMRTKTPRAHMPGALGIGFRKAYLNWLGCFSKKSVRGGSSTTA